jgi:hypothetical protein
MLRPVRAADCPERYECVLVELDGWIKLGLIRTRPSDLEAQCWPR